MTTISHKLFLTLSVFYDFSKVLLIHPGSDFTPAGFCPVTGEIPFLLHSMLPLHAVHSCSQHEVRSTHCCLCVLSAAGVPACCLSLFVRAGCCSAMSCQCRVCKATPKAGAATRLLCAPCLADSVSNSSGRDYKSSRRFERVCYVLRWKKRKNKFKCKYPHFPPPFFFYSRGSAHILKMVSQQLTSPNIPRLYLGKCQHMPLNAYTGVCEQSQPLSSFSF